MIQDGRVGIFAFGGLEIKLLVPGFAVVFGDEQGDGSTCAPVVGDGIAYKGESSVGE